MFDGATLGPGVWPDITTGSVTVTVPAPAAPVASTDQIQLRVAFVDPADRMGDVSDAVSV